ncbi:MAG: hypothetical protein EBQ73_02655 [Gammaproteobacteria bacterium]|nr:hypothetical protein [Gammaproteobacteria bacterium]
MTQGHYPTSRSFLSSLVRGFIGHSRYRWSPPVFFTACAAMRRLWSVAAVIEARPTAALPVQNSPAESLSVRLADAISKLDKAESNTPTGCGSIERGKNKK